MNTNTQQLAHTKKGIRPKSAPKSGMVKKLMAARLVCGSDLSVEDVALKIGSTPRRVRRKLDYLKSKFNVTTLQGACTRFALSRFDVHMPGGSEALVITAWNREGGVMAFQVGEIVEVFSPNGHWEGWADCQVLTIREDYYNQKIVLFLRPTAAPHAFGGDGYVLDSPAGKIISCSRFIRKKRQPPEADHIPESIRNIFDRQTATTNQQVVTKEKMA